MKRTGEETPFQVRKKRMRGKKRQLVNERKREKRERIRENDRNGG